jgi:hypothetical protein
MGAEPWLYFTPYKKDVSTALHELRRQEFQSGRYRGTIYVTKSEWTYRDWSGNTLREIQQLIQRHGGLETAIEAVFRATKPNGTASILDISQVMEVADCRAVCPLSTETLIEIFNTDKPTHDMVASSDIWDYLDRGQGVYLFIYEDEQGDQSPVEICFVGYSFD